MHWAKQLTLSARRGEAEAGALMLRLLFKRTQLLDLDAASSSPIDLLLEEWAPALAAASASGRVRFLMGLRRLITQRLEGFETGLAAWGAGAGAGGEEAQGGIVMVFGAIQVSELPFGGGAFASVLIRFELLHLPQIPQAARFVLEEAEAALGGEEEAAAWGREVEALVTLLERAMEVALCVIGTAEEGLPGSLLFEKEEGEGQEEGEYRSETAVQTAGPGFVVDCRGHLIRSNGGGGKGGGAEDEDEDEEGAGDGDDDDYDDDTRSVVFVHPSCLCICTALTPSLSFMDV